MWNTAAQVGPLGLERAAQGRDQEWSPQLAAAGPDADGFHLADPGQQ
jgi:hypothetical protein